MPTTWRRAIVCLCRTPITLHFRYCSARGAKRHLTYLGVTATLHSSSYTFVSISLPLHALLQSISLIISLPRQRSQEAHQISYHGPENPCTACQVDNCADTAAQFAAQFPNTGCLSPTQLPALFETTTPQTHSPAPLLDLYGLPTEREWIM